MSEYLKDVLSELIEKGMIEESKNLEDEKPYIFLIGNLNFNGNITYVVGKKWADGAMGIMYTPGDISGLFRPALKRFESSDDLLVYGNVEGYSVIPEIKDNVNEETSIEDLIKTLRERAKQYE